ncbi:hypothetical protein KSS87_005807, partial [Heliosperma pusillum]
MLLRSSSTPILNSWIPHHYNYYTSSNSSKESSPSPDHNTHELNLSPLSRTKSISTLSHDNHYSKPAICTVSETRQWDSPPLETTSPTPLQRLFSSSGLDEAVVTSEEEEEVGGGGVDGGSDDGKSGGGSGFNERGNNYHGHGSMEDYYKKMIQVNPGNSLLLGNYARFLLQVHGDVNKAEEYCGRAILASPSDANMLALYAHIIWQSHRDAHRAEIYFNQAVQFAPDDWYPRTEAGIKPEENIDCGYVFTACSSSMESINVTSKVSSNRYEYSENEEYEQYLSANTIPEASKVRNPILTADAFSGTYGVNYGRIADNLPAPESVATLLKAARIKNTRIYDADHSVLSAFNNTGIEIIVGLGNEFLKDIAANDFRATDWIKENVEPFLPGTKIVGIAVGNEVLGSQGGQDLWEALVPAVRNVYIALYRLNLAKTIEVSSPHSEGVFAASFPPSSGAFKEELMPYMRPLLQIFSQIGSPFYINAYPFLAYISDPSHIDIRYALFEKNPGIYDTKTKLHYDNMFMAQIDAAYAALEKVGFEKMEVIVSETGWASKGDPNEDGATLKNARTYNKNLKKLLMKRKGTPYRPHTVVKAYIFALFNEDLKPGPTSERNFGLFNHDGSISYDIGFTGLVPSSASSSNFSFK